MLKQGPIHYEQSKQLQHVLSPGPQSRFSDFRAVLPAWVLPGAVLGGAHLAGVHPKRCVLVLGAGKTEGCSQSHINKGFLQTEQVLLGLIVSDSRPARGELLISYILRKDGWYLSSSKNLCRSRPFPNGFGNYLLSYIHLKRSDSVAGLLLGG